MADALHSDLCRGHKIVNRYGENEISSWIKCGEYENQLREALDELSSLKLVNKFLQKEVLTYRPPRTCGRRIEFLVIRLVTTGGR